MRTGGGRAAGSPDGLGDRAMGMLVDGVWHTDWYDTAQTDGRFVRRESAFRDWVTADGASGFKAEPGRYHLYVSLACPWAHRTVIFRALKGLEDAISLSVVDPLMGDDGWAFSDRPGCVPDTVNGARYLREIYVKARPDYTGRVTVPVLWDKHREIIVSNESSEIIRMFNRAFDGHGRADLDFCPPPLEPEIDAVNAVVFDRVNNGVYKAGFATRQAPYEVAVTELFKTLDELEVRLGRQRYLVGDRITEADWRLFTTLVRFDPVYHGHFKCNLRRLIDYRNLWNYTRELYQIPGVAETVNLDHIKRHYYMSHRTINPTGIVPKGPIIDMTAPHDRARLPAAA
jgi:putative glutathione S-transferase